MGLWFPLAFLSACALCVWALQASVFTSRSFAPAAQGTHHTRYFAYSHPFLLTCSRIQKKSFLSWTWWHTPLIPSLRKQSQADFCEFKASLVCVVSFRSVRLGRETLSQKIKQNNTKTVLPLLFGIWGEEVMCIFGYLCLTGSQCEGLCSCISAKPYPFYCP